MNLPKRYEFKESEKKWRSYWEKNNIYKFNPKSKKKVYSIDTPPPYVSASHLHVGHAMHYSQFEFIARYKRMRGFNVFFPMGFDDNGLPTERYVEKVYKVDKSKVSSKEFTKLCLKETKKGIENYKKLWNLLGISVDWGLTYSTIDSRSVKVAQESFIDLYNKGFLERKNIPILWDVKLQTSLAQADLEDVEKESFFNDIVFKCENKDLIISTTRPELIPACVALFYHPKDKRYKKLKGKKAKVPLFNYEVPILEDKSVEIDKGTGLMMVCTFGDKEDIEKWSKYDLDLRIVISKNGKMNDLSEKYEGLEIKEARKKIIEDLKKDSSLINQKKITHVVNVSERSGVDIEFLKSLQWVVNVLAHKKELIKQGSKVEWYPDFMKIRYNHWVENLQWDWVISRQRFYGVPFPVWYHKKTGKIILPSLRELPVDPREGYIPKGYKKEDLIPETDVMDTWMTSSVTTKINDAYDKTKLLPMSLRPQAHDIIRTWAFYSIAKSYFHDKNIPWKDITISGHGLDSKGKKMSKSLGNFIEPTTVIEKYGSDAFRFWSASSNLGKDLPYKEEEVSTGLKTITKLWNASKFTLMHLEDFNLSKKIKLTDLDKGVLSKFNEAVKTAKESFEKYEYSKSKLVTDSFFWSTFCDNYLEIAKDRLYNPDRRGEGERKSAQYVLYTMLNGILKMFAPIMPFITEEIYNLYFVEKEKKKSIHLSEWPKYDKKIKDIFSEKIFDEFVNVLSEVRQAKAKENKSLKEEIVLVLPNKTKKLLLSSLEDLKAVTNAKDIKTGSKLKVEW